MTDADDARIIASLRDHADAARWLTDKVQRDWPRIPQSAHQMIEQSAVRNTLRDYKAKVLKVTTVPEAAALLRELIHDGVELGREIRDSVEASGRSDFPPRLPMSVELERAVAALENLTALGMLMKGKRGLRERVGEALGSTFALQDVGDLFNAGVYVGYAIDPQELEKSVGD